MFNKNRKQIKQLRIQLKRDRLLIGMLGEELLITKNTDDIKVLLKASIMVLDRMIAKHEEIERLKQE